MKLALMAISAMAVVSAPALGAGGITIQRDTVIPIVFDDSLTMQGNQPGDKFRAHVDDDHDLPINTKVEGRISGIKDKHGDDPAMMELQITEVILPDGSDYHVDAVPISLSDKAIHRDRDGRFVVQRDDHRTGSTVLAGAIGGFIVGSILHRQFEGVFLGTLAGVIAASTDKGNDGNTVVKNGDRMGMLLNHDLVIDFHDRGNPVKNEGGWRRPKDWNQGDSRDSGTQDDHGQAGPPPADDSNSSMDVQYGDKAISWGKDKPYWEKYTLMVPLSCLNSLGLKTDAQASDSTKDVFIDGPNGYLRLQIGSTEARVGGKPIDLDVAPLKKNGQIYVPLAALVEVCKDAVTVNGNVLPRHTDSDGQ